MVAELVTKQPTREEIAEKETELLRSTKIDADLERPALEAVGKYFEVLWDPKKGINALTQKLAAVKGPAEQSFNESMMNVMRAIQLHCSAADLDNKEAGRIWRVMCVHIEDDLKERYNAIAEERGLEETGNMLKIAPAWYSVKSTITQAFARKIDVMEVQVDVQDGEEVEVPRYETFTDLRREVTARGRKDLPAPSGSPAIRFSDFTAKLSGILQTIMKQAALLGPTAQDEIATVLGETLEPIQRIVDDVRKANRVEGLPGERIVDSDEDEDEEEGTEAERAAPVPQNREQRRQHAMRGGNR